MFLLPLKLINLYAQIYAQETDLYEDIVAIHNIKAFSEIKA